MNKVGVFSQKTDPELTPFFFEPEVLLRYDNDPRYDLNFDDYTGYLHSDDEKLPNPDDHIFSQAVGLGYETSSKRRVICMWLCDLQKLTPRHQDYWNSFLMSTPCKISEPFYNQQIMAEFNNPTLYMAALYELKVINEICKFKNLPNLFNQTPDIEDRPKDFKLNLLPTKKHFSEFINIADKLLSDNINKDFFKAQPTRIDGLKTSDGRDKGTLSLLNEYVDKIFRPVDGSVPSHSLKSFKELRSLRNPNAHKISTNEYDYAFHEKQEKLFIEVYTSLRSLRLIFMNFPNVRGNISIPDWLAKGEFTFY